MSNSHSVLVLVTSATFLADYLIKRSTLASGGIFSAWFVAGTVIYGFTAFGWYMLMKTNSLAAVGVMFSTTTILLLAALGYFVFKEQFGLRETLGVSLAILAVVIMNPK